MPPKKSNPIEAARPVPKARTSVSNPSPTKKIPRLSKSSSQGSISSHLPGGSTSAIQRRTSPRLRAPASWDQSFEEIVNGNGNLANEDAMEEFSDSDGEEEPVVNAPEGPKPASAFKAMKKFITGLVDIYTIIGVEPVVMGHSIFRKMMVTLHVTLNYGYYLCLIPFKISDTDGSYKFQTFLPHQIITWFMQLVCVFVLVGRAIISIGAVDIRDDPNSLCDAMTRTLTLAIALSFIYAVSGRGNRFFKIFSSFNRRICKADRKKQTSWKIGLIQFLPFLVYFAISNWRTWGVHLVASKDPLKIIYNKGVETFILSEEKPTDFVYYLVISFQIICCLYTDIWTYYVHALLWAASYTVYFCEKLSRKVTLESKDPFVIKEGNILFGNQRILMRKLNLALGPIIVIFYAVVIPFVVYTICEIFLKPENFPLTEVAMIPLIMGHIFVACEGCSNADDLVYDILVKKVPAITEEIEKNPNRAKRTYLMTKYFLMVNKFRDIVQRAICLRAMDYFAVNYELVGSVAQWLITSLLLIAEWSRDSDKTIELKLNATELTVNKIEVNVNRIEGMMMSILDSLNETQNYTMKF